jgi:hypothetical protein
MGAVERYSDAPFEIWHDGILVAVVYQDKILINGVEDVEVIFGEIDDNQWRLMN